MKSITKICMLFAVLALGITSCKKELNEPQQDEVSQETMAKISSLGFGTSNVQKIEEGYLVEGDIILTESSLNERPTSPWLRIAEVEQYRTFNLVTGLPRTITVSSSGSVNTAVSNAINAAILRYND